MMAKEDTLEKFGKDWNERPKLKELDNYVVIKCATAWMELGRNLKIDEKLLNIIEKDNPHSCENCCSKMLYEWLDSTPEASWQILLDAMQNLSTDTTEKLHSTTNILPETVEKLDSTADKLDAKVDKLSDIAEKLDNGTDQLPNLFEKLDSTTDKLPNAVEKLESATNKVDVVADKLPNTVEKLDNAANRLPGAVDQLYQAVNELPKIVCKVQNIKETDLDSLADTYVQPATNHLRENYIKSRFYYAPDDWPPYHIKHYTTLALIHHKGRHVNTEVISITEGLVTKGNLSKNQPANSNISYHIKDISELFPNNWESSYFLLIEGAPGIGKTVLSKEIAYQWATDKLLNDKKLAFLLFLRDPNLKHFSSLENLIEYLVESTEIASGLTRYLSQNKGKGLVIIFDGYDEMSEEDRNNSVIAKIVSRNLLPECDLVITSRPSSSLYLRDVANCRVEVLGFTEEDRLDYIQHALQGLDNKIKALQFYLQSNSTINALCYVPLNMTILLCLFEEIKYLPDTTWDVANIGLPSTQTEMYENFTLMTITRFIKKKDKSFSGKCLKISDLPEAYNKVFSELLCLAYNALTKDQIVFNLNDEVMQMCPILKSSHREGLGLLKVTEHINNVSFHFLHFSIQEYLAAYYIASQSRNFQVQMLTDTFWDIHYFNTWIMYVGITGGKKTAWKHFISGNWFVLSTRIFKAPRISKSLLNDKIKSLHLFQCFAEMGQKELLEKVFKDKIIDLSYQTLLPKDISAICFFLLRSVKQNWTELNLANCNVGDIGSDIICSTFLGKCSSIVSINKVDLSYNQLQIHAISALLDVFKVWNASEVVMQRNNDLDVGNLFELCLSKFSLCTNEDLPQTLLVGSFLFTHNFDYQTVYGQLTSLANITGLYLHCSNCLSKSLEDNKKLICKMNLSKLHIIGENIHKHFIMAIAQKLNNVDCVYIYDHTLSDEDVDYISSMLLYKVDSGIWVVTGSTKILGNIPNILTLKKQLSHVEIFNLAESIKRSCSIPSSISTAKFSNCSLYESRSAFEKFFHVLQKNISKCKIRFCLVENNILIANRVKYDKIKSVLSSDTNLFSVFIKKCELNAAEIIEITNLINKQESLERLYIFDSSLEMQEFKYDELLNQNLQLKELFMHNTNLSCTLTFDLLSAQKDYPNISILLIGNNTLVAQNPTDEQISLSIQLKLSLTICKFWNFVSSIESFQQMVDPLSSVVELDILGNNFNVHEAIANNIFYNLRASNLTKLNISHNEFNKRSIDSIAEFLSHIPKLGDLDLSYNALAAGTLKALNEINTSSFTRLNISNNSLSGKAAHNIATFLSHNPQVKELDLGCNNLQAAGAIIICKEMGNLLSLTKLNVSNNNISGEAADYIAVALSQSYSLEELDLSYNNLGALGSSQIFSNMTQFSDLIKLNVCSIGVTEISADKIATILNNNKNLKEFDLSHNNIQAAGATLIFKETTSVENLHKLDMSYNNITADIDYLTPFLSRNTKLQNLNFSHNHLEVSGAEQICKASLSTLYDLNMSYNAITTKASNYIRIFLSHNTNLQKLDLSGNNLQEFGHKNIFKSLHITSNLSSLRISHSSVVNEAADELATSLLQITSLLELDLSYSNLSTLDAIKIFKGMKNISNLEIMNISHNAITNEAVDLFKNVLHSNFQLKEIDLSCNKLSTADAIKIFEGMKSSSNFEAINVSQNMISDEAAESIATILSHNNKLKSLDLSANYFGCKGFVKIFNSLKNMKNLRKLNVSYNKITVIAANSITTVLPHDSKLEELNISNNFMQTVSVIIIFKSLQHISGLKKLYINCNVITNEAADHIAVVLSKNTKLEKFNISYNNLQAVGIAKIFREIRNVSSLKAIDISHNMITDEAAESIATILSHNNELRSIDLSSNYLKSEGLDKIFEGMKGIAHLRKLKISCNEITGFKAVDCIAKFLLHSLELEELDLSNNFMHTAGIIKVFKSMKNILNLRKISINGNMITDEAANYIAVVLSQNTKLEELDLGCNNLQTAGAITIFQAIMHISTLTKLNIAHNMITNEITEYIVSVMSNSNNLRELNLSHNNIVIFDFTKCNFSNLQELDVSYTNKQTAISIEDLNAFTLKKCNISNNYVTAHTVNGIAAFLSENDQLQELDLSYNDLTIEGTKSILDFLNISNLMKLNISTNNITSNLNYITNILTHATKLVQLDLSNNKLSSDKIQYFLHKIKSIFVNLVKLNLSGNEICDGAATALASILSENTKLKELNLNNTYLQREGVSRIFSESRIFHLTKLSISNNSITDEAADDISSFLSECNELKELDLSHNHLKSAGTMKICKTNLTKLTSFYINHNSITSEAANDLAAFISQNSELKILDLSANNLQEWGCKSIFSALNHISFLCALTICNSSVVNTAANELATVLLHNTFLRKLDLSYNNLSTSDAVKIFKGMKNISNLETIDISHNKISDEAAESIATVFSHNNQLKSLDLSFNYFRSKGCIKIFKLLRNVMYLKMLNISCNEISANAAESIAAVLSHNLKLEELNLSNNFMKTMGITIIFESLKQVSSLKKVLINNNMITDEAAEHITEVLFQSTKLEELDISCNDFQTMGATKIFQDLRYITTLTKLNIGYNMITDQVLPCIGAVLVNCDKLNELNLSCNDLKNVNFFHKIKLSCLNKFTFSNATISEIAATEISGFLSHCTNLKVLDLSYNNLLASITVKIFEGMNSIVNLESLNISHNMISDEAAEKIATVLLLNNKLESLDLSFNYFRSEGFVKIFGCLENTVHLRKLDISCNEITTRAVHIIAAFLSHILKLEEFGLGHNLIHTTGIIIIFKSLRHISSLKKIVINNNMITDEAADDIATVLSQNTKLEELNVSGNNLQTGGVIKIYQGIRHASNLITLNVASNMITDQVMPCLASILFSRNKLRELNLSDNDLKNLNAFHTVKMPYLSDLKFNNIDVSEKGVTELSKFLSHCTNLQGLGLSHNNLSTSNTIIIFKGMKNISNLETINISHNMITDEAAESIAAVLAHNNKLKSIDLSFNYFRSEGFVKIFNGIKNTVHLKKLSVGYNEITATAVNNVANLLLHNLEMKELDLSNNFMQTPGIITVFKSMRNISNLRKLCIHNNVITQEAANHMAVILSENTKLEKLDICCNSLQPVGVITIFKGMKFISTLTSLNISHNMITDEAMKYVMDILLINSKLKELNLSHINLNDMTVFKDLKITNLCKFNFSYNSIDKQSAYRFSFFLSHCTSLQALNLSCTNLHGAGVTRLLSEVEIFSLKELNISGNNIEADESEKIAIFMSRNDKLEELDLSYNNLKELGIRNILGSINISNLHSLNICNNNITGDLKYIVDILTLATKLVKLDISRNNLSSDNIEYFMHKIKNILTNLINLDLSGNEVCRGAITALASFLSNNTKLKELNLNDTNLQAEESSKILSTLKISSLTKLYMSHNDISKETASDIATFLSKCNELKKLDLSHNHLKSAGIMNICRSNLTKLTTLNISHNSITIEATNELANFLCQNSELQILNLSYNNLQESGCKNIIRALKATSVLSVLTICNSGVINEAAEELATVLLHNTLLQEIDLSCNNLSTLISITIFKGMKNISNLKAINVSHNKITDEAAESIATVFSHNNKLESLNLSSNYFRSEGFVKIFKSLRNNVYLQKLNISSNEINGIAATSIARVFSQSSKLEELHLGETFMQTAGIIAIFRNLVHISNLKKLCINGNMITNAAADDIAVVLSQNTRLEELDISSNNLQIAGVIKIFQGIRNISTLTEINIAHNMFSDEAMKYVADALSNQGKLRKLNLSHTDIKSVVIFQLLNASNLTEFNFSYNNITKEMTSEISAFLLDCATLQTLDMSYTNLQIAGGIDVLNTTVFTLKKFSISGNLIPPNIAENIAVFLSENDELEELDLSRNNLQESIINNILQSICISNLTKLNISDNNIITNMENIACTLSSATKLVDLDLSCNKFSANAKTYATFVNLTKFNISENKIGNGNTAVALANSLFDNTKLKELYLSSNRLNAEGLSKILAGLNMSTLIKFDVSHNDISDKAADDIATFLSKNSKLQDLDLSHNNLQSAGAIKVCRTSLTELTNFNVSHNNITIEAANDITTFLSHNAKLQVLDLSCNDLQEYGCKNVLKMLRDTFILFSFKFNSSYAISKVRDELATVLHHSTLLQEIDLSHNSLSTSDAIKVFQGMKNVPNLEAINISHNMITDEAAEYLASVLSRSNKLKTLDLSSNLFKDGAFVSIFQRLKNIVYLRKLSISCNEISTKGARSIAMFLSHNSNLEELYLGNNFMQTSDIIVVFKSLRHISSLKKLYINDNMITDEAAEDIAVVLSQNTKLEELDVSCNNLQTAGVIKIFHGIKHTLTLAKFNIAHNMFTDEATKYIVDCLSNKSNLKELNLSNTNINEATIFQAVELLNLTKFIFSCNTITKEMTDEVSEFISNCGNLQTLDLSYTNLQAAGSIDVLNAVVITLKHFNICGNSISSHAADKIAVFLSDNDELEELDLSCNDLQESGIDNILKSICISNVTKLSIRDNNITTDLENVASTLIGATKLVELDLSHNKFSANPMDSFSYASNAIFTNLTKLDISGSKIGNGTAAVALANSLADNAKLKEFNLSNNDLNAEGLSKILNRLKMSTLIKLNISHNNVSDKAAGDIKSFLSTNPKLKHLDLSHNNLQSAGIIKICRINLAELTAFNISNNKVTDEAAENISTILSLNNQLESLDLSSNYFKCEGLAKIFDCLKNVKYLRKLNVSGNEITSKAADTIATFLSCNSILEELNLSNSFMQTSDAIKIFKHLRNTSRLKKLFVHNNMITNEGAENIATVLRQNTKLEEFDISYNNMQASGAIKIFLCVECLLNLSKVNIAYNLITDEAVECIVDVLSVNSKLKELNLSNNNINCTDALENLKAVKL